jgi:hypothetical protein
MGKMWEKTMEGVRNENYWKGFDSLRSEIPAEYQTKDRNNPQSSFGSRTVWKKEYRKKAFRFPQ